MFYKMHSFVSKIYNYCDDFIFEKEERKSYIRSIILWLLMIILLVADYLISNKYYLNYNFNINSNIAVRAIKILPLFIIISYCYFFILPNKISNFEMLYWMLFYILTLVPTLVVYVLNGIGDQKHILIYIYTFEMIAVAGIYLMQKINLKIPKVNISENKFWIFLIAFIIMGYAYIIIHLGIPTVKGYSDIYAVRLNYRKYANRLDDYFVMWLGNVINPFLFAYMIRKRKFKWVWIPIILELVLYLYSAYRIILAVFVLAPIFAYVVNRGIRKSLILFASVIGVIGGVLTGMLNKLTIYVLLGQRIFIWPPLIALQYYDFFSMYPKMYLAHSVLGHFINNGYLMEPSLYMGSLYYGRPEMRLNTAWYADAYMNFGIIGIILFAVLLVAILLFIKAMEDKDIYLVSSLLFGGIIALFNAPLLTGILTHGIGIGLLIAYILPTSICKKKCG